MDPPLTNGAIIGQWEAPINQWEILAYGRDHIRFPVSNRSRVAARKEDFTATGPELEAAPGLNYKIAPKTAEIEPKSNQVRRPKMK